MIVDCHTHIVSTLDQAPQTHLSATETVDACIVLASWDAHRKQVNENLSSYIAQHSDRMVGFAVIDPAQDTVKKSFIQSMTSDMGLQGLVLYCATSGCHPLHSQALRVYEAAEQLVLPVFFHGPGDGEQQSMLSYAQPYFIDEVAVTFPDLRIIIGNMGRPFLEQTLAVIAKNQHVYADLSIRPNKVWQTYNTVVAAHERGVMDKLLFGSAFPVENANVCIEALLGFNMLLADTNLPTVPRGTIRDVIERHALDILQIENNIKPRQERDRTCTETNEKA